MSLSIYVAGASADREMIAGFLVELRAAGWTVTYDWTTDPGWTDPTWPRAVSAQNDCDGVIAARTFWYVAPTTKSEGSHFELGAAVLLRRFHGGGQSRTILTSGPIGLHSRIFPTLANRHFAEHTMALAWLTRHAQERQAADAIAEWHCVSCGIPRGDVHEPWCSNSPGER